MYSIRALGVILGAASLFLLGSYETSEAQEIRGAVTQADTGEPLAGVRVWLQTASGSDLGLTTTDVQGEFGFRVDEPGMYRLRFLRIGFLDHETRLVAVGEGAEVELEIELMPDPVRLPGIAVEVDRLPAFEVQRATYTGLYMRRGDTRWATPGGSRVFVRADLEPHTGATVREFIERNAPSTIQTQLRTMRANERRRFLGQRLARGRAIGCDAPFFMIRGAEGHGLEIEMYLDMPLRDMEGIEFYRQGHHAPLELRHSKDDSATSCGVVVIWPRQVGELR